MLKHANHPQQPPFCGITFKVLFVGLDASSSLELLQHLNVVAESGRLIILTIHQPRLEIFHLFHKILLLCDGQVGNCSPHMGTCSPHVGNCSLHVGSCSPYVIEFNLSKTVLDTGFPAVDSWIPGIGFLSFRQWNLDYGFQSLVGSWIP